MAQAVRIDQKVTIADFDVYVAGISDAIDCELVDGEIVMMGNPTETHEQIASNIGAPLKLAMDKRGCRTYQGGIRVQADDNSNSFNKFKPDVVVRCGEPGTKTYITDPVVIVEVLSPSTMENDRGHKLRFYKSLPTVQHVVLVYSKEMRVEHWSRSDDPSNSDDGWVMTPAIYPDETVRLDAVEFEIDLEQVYFSLPF
jgi:Uma2 family endonuclease